MNPKLQWLRNKMSSLDLQGLILTNPVNIRYLTNIEAEGILLLTRKDNIYITDARYIEAVHSTLTLFDEIIVYDIHDVSKDDYENFFMFCENVGFEEYDISYAKYKEYIRKYKINNFVETEHIIEKQRMIKDKEEIINIQKACEITDNCFSYILNYIKPGMTEKQIADEIIAEYSRLIQEKNDSVNDGDSTPPADENIGGDNTLTPPIDEDNNGEGNDGGTTQPEPDTNNPSLGWQHTPVTNPGVTSPTPGGDGHENTTPQTSVGGRPGGTGQIGSNDNATEAELRAQKVEKYKQNES